MVNLVIEIFVMLLLQLVLDGFSRVSSFNRVSRVAVMSMLGSRLGLPSVVGFGLGFPNSNRPLVCGSASPWLHRGLVGLELGSCLVGLGLRLGLILGVLSLVLGLL